MGTDSAVSNMYRAVNHSRTNEMFHWCSLITKLPTMKFSIMRELAWEPVMMKFREKHKDFIDFLTRQFHHCLPLFAHIVMELLSSVSVVMVDISTVNLFNWLMCKVATALHDRKIAMHKIDGLRGQLAMHLCAHGCRANRDSAFCTRIVISLYQVTLLMLNKID
jgi:hypothetical protein